MLSDRDIANNTPLHLAVENDHYGVVKLCILEKADINTPANNSIYLLHLAAKTGNVRIVKILVKNGARIDVRNVDMSTPLHIAAQYSHTEKNHDAIVEFFLRQYVFSI